jgi:iron complex outermembrane receptor protein
VQFGGSAREKFDYRVYGKYFDEREMRAIDGGDGGDGWHLLRAGARTDMQLSESDTLTVQGDMYTGREGNPTFTLPSIFAPGPIAVEEMVNLSGGFVQSMWGHTFSERSNMTLNGSYDTYERSDVVNDHRNTVNLDFQHEYLAGERHRLVWGASYRYTADDSEPSVRVELIPSKQNETIYGFFAQDEIEAIAGRLYITVGSKFENNTYSGFAAMPTARAVYQFSQRRMAWVAVSRAERTPEELDTSLRANEGAVTESDGTLAVLSVFGNPKLKNEALTAYEAGYRMTAGKTLAVDLAAYYNDYDRRISDEPGAPFFEATPGPPHLVLPVIEENLQYGETHGAEIAAKWKAASRWTIESSYDFERLHFHRSAGSQDLRTGPSTEGGEPREHARLRSHVQITQKIGWNLAAYFTDRLPAQGVPSYTRLDTNLIWRLRENVTIGFYGENLLKDRHLEFNDPENSSTRATLIPRSGYAKLTWRF